MGYAKSKWSEEKGGGQRVETYRACESYFNEVSCLLGDFEDNKTELTAGQHKFDVSYALSSHLPTSFKCKNGSIKYKIRITIDRSWKLNSTYEFPFTVIRPLNLNDLEATVRNPMKEELSKNFKWDFTSESLYMSASIPFRAYVPGQVIDIRINQSVLFNSILFQTIDVKIQVNNQSRTHVKEIKCSLKKIIFLHSFRPKKKTKMLIEAEGKVCTDTVPILTVQTFHEQLVVPSLPPNISNCDIIKVSYELRVKAKTSGFSRSPKLKFPITIGTVPLESRGDNIPSSPSCASLRKFYGFI